MDANAQAPVADFSASVVAGCGPLSVQFQDLSSGSPIYWTWDFGNGQISNLQNPIINYATPGSYTVTLIVKNKNGASSARKTDYITVYPYPTVNFTSNLTVGCAPANIFFTDGSIPGQGYIAKWNWSFGDGSSSNLQNPGHVYSQTGYYQVGLTVTNSQGCSFLLNKPQYLRIVQGVQASFAWSQGSNSCSAPFLVNMNNQTAGPGNLSYSWDLGNGGTSTQANPTTSYPANTNYTVILTAQSDLGCSDTAERIVSFPISNPTIMSPDSACANAAVSFANGSNPAPLSSAWTFGDGNGSSALNPGHTYATVANYSVKLVNTYAVCADSLTRIITIVNSPAAGFTAVKTGTCKAPFTANFQDASTGGAVSWQWDFGDGSTSTLQNPSHTYMTTDSFDVTLTVKNSTGCSSTIKQTKFIRVTTPTLSLSNPAEEGCVNSPVFSPAAVVNAVDGVASWSWAAPGAVPATSTSVTPTFTYSVPGNYGITLTVMTNDGCTATTTFTDAAIVGVPTPALFTASNTNPCVDQGVYFSSTSTPADEYDWNFGDGAHVQGDSANIHHYYKDEGPHNITLTVWNHGCPQTLTKPGYIIVNPPVAGFSFATSCANIHQVSFTDTSLLDPAHPATYVWNFGDGTLPLTIVGPPGSPLTPHTYAVLQPYTVTLTVTNGACTDATGRVVTLDSLTSSFTAPDSVCRNASFPMTSTNASPSLITDYTWQVMGTIPPVAPVSTGTTPSYSTTLNANGPYSLSLTITDVNGCQFTSQPASIQVTGPTAQYAPPGTGGGCLNSPILFNDLSTPDATSPLKKWIFNFGDGVVTNFTGPPFTHMYSDTGYFGVGLTLVDAHNCVASFGMNPAVLITAPRAGFFAGDTLYCPNAPLPFTDSSKGYIQSWLWNFGDGSPTSSQQDPTHSFPTNGQHYSVKLKVTDKVGCSDSLTRTNYILIQKPIAAFTLADSTAICTPLQSSFTPNGQYYDSLYWDFGDGTTSTLPVTTHFYNTYDTFYVKLFLQGPGGCLDSATRRIFVLNPNTTTSFLYGPLESCDSVRTVFTITPPGYSRFTLFFGDATIDSSQNTSLSHLYKSPNTYDQQLILQDATGCQVGIRGTNMITVLGATPFFTIDKHAFCDSATVNFTDYTITNDPITGEKWFFGDGTTFTPPSPGVNPSHDYTTPGILPVTLNVTTQSNCAENYTDTITVYQTPHPVFTMTGTACSGAPLQFMGNLTQPDIDSVAWAWDFGDGQTSVQQNPSISFPRPATYTVSLRTSLSFGCSDTTSQAIAVHTLPTAKGPSEITIAEGFPTVLPFTYGGTIETYAWTPAANLSCTDCADPLADPVFKTVYTVTVTDSNNCVFTDSILVRTVCNGKNYFIPNTFSPNGDGVNDVFYPRGDNLYNIQTMRVFNRWGQMVFEKRDFPANSAASGWDGTFNGRPAPVDVYVYIVEVVCDNAQVVTLNGNVTLIR